MSSFRVGTYNICHASYADGDLSKIAEVIRQSGLDICGIQEVDLRTGRVGRCDQPAELARLSGLEYYRFAKAIDYDGGEYGTLILSRFPIRSFECIGLFSEGHEGRSVGHAVLELPERTLDFFNTHLAFEHDGIRQKQFEQLAALLSDSTDYVLTGDFNTDDFSEFDVLKANRMLNRPSRRVVTFPGSQSAIDNILVSASLSLGAPQIVKEAFTDHYMLWTTIESTDTEEKTEK